MTHVGPGLALTIMTLLGSVTTVDSTAQTGRIVIRNEGRFIPHRITNYPAGPTDPASAVNIGNILNAHYYPGLTFYTLRNYADAKSEMDYVLARPQYIENNPRRNELMSTAHYIRGAIYFHHALGPGRSVLAWNDFEAAIKWNPSNQLAQIELARMMAVTGQKDEAIAKLKQLLSEKPTPTVAEEVGRELDRIMTGKAE
jgi:hypothetical protein